jgi:hypothetical protein
MSCWNPFNLFNHGSITMNSTAPVDILLLGSGWTGTFLIPHLDKHHPSISYAHTTRDGRDSSIAWTWDEQGGADQYEALPAAKTVVVVFPIKTVGGSTALVEGYESVHGKGVRWIQLGSSGIWDVRPRPSRLEDRSADRLEDREDRRLGQAPTRRSRSSGRPRTRRSTVRTLGPWQRRSW